MATLQDIQTAVAAQTTVEASVVTMINGLALQLKDALAANDPVAVQALVDQIGQNTATLAAAVQANTPAPTPTPAAP
jgi:hypothetical protein